MLSSYSVNYSQTADSPTPTYWHDDCSSVDGWVENTTNIDGLLEYVQTGIDLLTDGNSLSSDNIPAYAVNEHGPQFFKKLPYPMMLKDDLELQVEFEHIGTPDRIGSVGVALLDQNNSTILTIEAYDNSYFDDSCNAQVTAIDSGGDTFGSYGSKSGAWMGTERGWFDSTIGSILADIDGRYRTVVPVEWTNSEKEVHYIGLFFYCGTTGTYESSIVNDILLTTSSSESNIATWFHDCSNTTGFDRNLTWPLDGWLSGLDEWTLTEGGMSIYDDDNYYPDDHCYFSGIPSATSGWHGPAFVHKLDNPFPLNRMKSFAVQLEVDNSFAEYAGKIQVLLIDSNLTPVVRAYIGDASDSIHEGQIFAEYMCPNGTSYRHGLITVDSFTEFDGSMIFRYDETIGVSASVTGYGESILYSPNVIEVQREITHILILTGRLADNIYMPSVIDDISLKWDLTEPEPTQTTTGTPGMGIIEYLTISVGIGAILVIVVVIVKKRKI